MKSELIIDVEDMSKLAVEDNEMYAMNRKRGFGASDSSILLGVNHWTQLTDLIAQKNLDYISDEEKAVGEKPQVRMGADLEPLILSKAEEFFGVEIQKPNAQYRLEDYMFLTINYDGMTEAGMPVEAKCVTSFARKYWDFSKACTDLDDFLTRKPYHFATESIKEMVEEEAKMYGIPPYYYTQCQQQMMGTDTTYCALAALDVKNWSLNIFKIFENETIQQAIVMNAASAAELCNKMEEYL